MKKYVPWIAAGVTLVGMLIMWWLSGFNFDTRGNEAAACFVFTAIFVGAVFFFTALIVWEDGQ